MTCHDTPSAPLAPSSATDVPMAHHIYKWWRNKFRNGYKKFHVSLTDGERTDTEELVERGEVGWPAPPDLLPSAALAALRQPPTATPQPPEAPHPAHPVHPAPANDDPKKRIRCEELTCDVELQHPEPSKQQPLQFSFTLYDLDGHGRMTKDDIAGIVSTIYESIGKSVTVPHYGSKTIQVRLTVTPSGDDDNRQHNLEESEKELSAEEVPSKCCEGRCRPRAPRPRRAPRDRRHKKRSGSLQRRELLEIIQANMEKNNLSFQTTRKPNDSAEENRSKQHKMRNRSHTFSEKPSGAARVHRRPLGGEGGGYLDLAGGAEVAGDSHLCRYDRYLHAVICSSARHATTGYHQKGGRPPRAPHPPHPHTPRNVTTQPRVLQIILL